jgi:iron-sulfur cluster insertion protein
MTIITHAKGSANGRKMSLSDAAVAQVTKLKEQEEKEDLVLRAKVFKSDGCGDFKYGLQFVDQVSEDDIVFEHGEVALVVDDMSLTYLNGAMIDFFDNMTQSGFILRNPNAKSTCGCGRGFTVDEDQAKNSHHAQQAAE